jgi:NarL family two-component system sensor histidine kinase YdfH
LEAADSRLAGDQPGRAREIVQQAMARARAALADSRRVIDDLRAQSSPPDLAQAARAAADRFTAETGLPCALEIAIASPLSEEVREHACRVVAEGLSNIARHAKAQHAWVKLVEENGRLEIEVRDDGLGFDPGAAAPGHYGLLGIREYARLAGGTMTVHSAAGEGARLTVQLPLEA